jgi:hypothetical protein
MDAPSSGASSFRMQVTDGQIQRLERLAEAAEEVLKRFRLSKDTMTRQEVRALGDLEAAVVHARLSISQILQSARRSPGPEPPV